MEKETRRIRRAEKKPSGLANWLRREGRRCCAVALCVSMIVGNAANLAFAAEESISGSFLFRLDRASLYDALQEAVMEGDIVDKEFEFKGEAAEEYDLLLNEMEGHDGELYELKPEIAHNEGNLGLRIFARLDGEIPLGDEEETVEYEITGSEEFIFLLTNRSHKEYQAVIQVDDKRSEVITVVPGSSLQAGLEDSPYTSAADFGPGETEGAGEVTGTGITTAPGGGSSGGGGGGGGGSSHKDNTPQEGAEDTANHPESGENSQDGDSAQNPEDQGAEEKDHNNGSAQEGEASGGADNSSNDSNGAEMNGSDHNHSNGSDSGSNDSGQNDSDKSDSGDSSYDSDNGGGSASEGGSSENSGSSDSGSGSSGSDHSSGSGSSGDGAGSSSGSDSGSSSSGGSSSDSGSSGSDSGSSSGSGSDSSSSGSSSSGSSSSGSSSSGSSSSGSSSSGSSSDSGSSGGGSSDSGSSSSGGSGRSGGDSGSSGGGEQSASISRHGVSLVAMSLDEIVASPSDAEAADKEEIETEEIPQTEKTGELATDADAEEASPSDADEELLDGQIYEPALLGDDAVVAFVTTAAEMLLDEEDYRTASPSNACPAKIREFQADGVVVVVEAEDGVLPEDAELTVKELVKEEADTADQYEQAEKALEEAGTEYAGMMAFDISFWLDGEEIEPEGPVQVSMRVDSEKLPKEADPESLEIHHLVGTDEIEAVEIVADSGDKAEGIIEVDEAEALAAEFEVESFSTFTITWGVINPFKGQYGDAQIVINATCQGVTDEILTDLNKKEIEIPYYQGAAEAKIDLAEDSQTAQIGWYHFVKAQTTLNGSLKEFTKIGVSIPNSWAPVWVENEKFENEESRYRLEYQVLQANVNYYDANDSLIGSETKIFPVDINDIKKVTYINEEGIKTSIDAYGKIQDDLIELNVSLVYKKDDRQIRLVDNIKNTGCLEVEFSSDLSETEKEGVTYKWYRSSDRKAWNDVTEESVLQGGKAVNIAMDNGSRYYYKVEVYKRDGSLLGQPEEFFVEYYDQLKNGSFEYPEVADSNEGGYGNYYQYPEGTGSLIWKTTESSKSIELVKKGNLNHNLQQGTTTDLPDGNQCAELNSRDEGALYQDVLTIPGSTLHWRLYHRARGPQNGKQGLKDTMYLVIMPTSLAEGYDRDHQKLKREVEEYLDGEDVYDSPESGIYVQKIVSPNYQWSEYDGHYETGNRGNSCLTRFFFIAGDDVSSRDIREGNLLDDVWFDTQLPPPKPDKGNLYVRKTVSGFSDLSETDRKKYQEDYKLNLKISKDGKLVETVELKDFKDGTDGTWYDYISRTDWEPGTYTVEESVSSVDNYDLKFFVREGNGEGGGDFKEGSSITVEIKKDETTYIEFKNDYTPQTANNRTLTVEKEVTGNLGNRNKNFTFEYKIVDGEDKEITDYSSIEVGGEKVTGNRKFQLKHGEKTNIAGIPSGYKVIIKEIDADGYEVSAKATATGDSNKELSLTPLSENNAIVKGAYELTVNEDTEVLFTNHRSLSTPTGVHGNKLPHLLLLAMAALGMAGMAATGTTAKARKKNDEQ